jgi:DNA-binding winged helix-turn-helix (wHTH) protein/tetratricopeptide (TPR) repeat protein
MGTTSSQSRIVQFGLFQADLERRELRKSGVRLKLHEQPFQILILLLDRAGEVVTREEIREKLWPGNTFVEFDNGLNVAVTKLRAALGDNADNPRFVETIPRRGYRFVAAISVPETVVARSASPEKPVSDSTAPVFSVGPSPAAVASAGWGYSKQLQLLVALMVCVLALAGWAAYHWRTSLAGRASAKSSPAPGINSRRSVAVLGFRNLPGRPEDDWVSTAFTEMLSTELAAGGNWRMISEEDVSRAKRDLRFGDADTLARSTLASLRVDPGADVVVLGSCTPIEEKGQKRIRVDVRLQDTALGETIAEEAFSGDEGRLFDIAAEAGTRLRQRMGANPASAEALSAAQSALPSNQQSIRLYAEGRAKYWDFEYLAARDLLMQAVAADPGNAAAHLALANAWSALGYMTSAQEEAKQALDHSSALSREEQLSTEGRYRELTADWPKASEIYRSLTQFFPDNLEYGLRLAGVLSKAGRTQDSLVAIAALRRLPKPISDDPRIDLQEADTFDRAGDYQRLQTASANAAAKAHRRGSRVLLAEARLKQSLAASRLNDPQGALALDGEAQQIYQEVGDKYGFARAQYRMADLLFQQGAYAQSNALLEQCLRVFRTLGSDGDAATTLNDIAGGLFEMGELIKAKNTYEEALVSERLVRNKRGTADVLSNLGALLEQQGELGRARNYDEEALALYDELGDKGSLAVIQNNTGEVLVDQGDLLGAKSRWEKSLALRREFGNESDVAESMHNLAGVLGEQGDVAGAQKLFDDALAIRSKRGEQGNVAATRLGKAELMVESGSPGDSEPLLRSALEQFKKEKQVQLEVSAHATLAQAFLELDRVTEAKKEIEQATRLADKNESYSVHLKTQIVAAQVFSAGGKSADAGRNLRLAIKAAQKAGFFVRRLEASLALAEIEAKTGSQKESLALFRSVEKDARSKGFLLIAGKAASDSPPKLQSDL